MTEFIIFPLSPATESRLMTLFVYSNVEEAKQLLTTECGNNLTSSKIMDAKLLERLRFAVLKLSDGTIEGLVEALVLAQTDWRDLLMAAGFGTDVISHLNWRPRTP